MSTGERVLWILLVVSILIAIGSNFYMLRLTSGVREEIDRENQNIRELQTKIAVIEGHREEMQRIHKLLDTISSKVINTDDAKALLEIWENKITNLSLAYTIAVSDVKILTSQHESVNLNISARTGALDKTVEIIKILESSSDKWLEISNPPTIQKVQDGYTISVKLLMPYQTDKVDNLWDLK